MTERDHNLEIVIKNAIKAKYEEYGFADCLPLGVSADSKKIRVILDTETPFMGEKFSNFVGDVCEELDNALKIKGKVSHYASLCIINWPAD